MKREENSGFEEREELTAEELEMLKARVETLEDRSQIPPPERKQNKMVKFARNNTVATVIIAALALAIIAVVILLGVYLARTSAGSKKDYTFVFKQFGEYDEEVKYDYEAVVINDMLYVDMNKLAQFGGMAVSGGDETMKYIAADDNYVKFTNESEYAVINANKVVIPAPAYVSGDQCLVPYQLISKIVASGISFRLDQMRNTVTITRKNFTDNDVVYNEKITFTHADLTVVSAITSTASVDFEYNIDVSCYLSAIDPEKNEEYLLLVNRENPLSAYYIPENMVQIPMKYTKLTAIYLDTTAAQALVAMMEAMIAEGPGNNVYVTSAYRSYKYQDSLFEGYVREYIDKGYSREEAEAEVIKTSAYPGTSEHQSALCIDFITLSMNNGLNNAEFEQSSAFRWLAENAYKFGYVLRYPDAKTDVTGYSYESWHYRFVGRRAATEMYFSDLCLEEYIELI